MRRDFPPTIVRQAGLGTMHPSQACSICSHHVCLPPQNLRRRSEVCVPCHPPPPHPPLPPSLPRGGVGSNARSQGTIIIIITTLDGLPPSPGGAVDHTRFISGRFRGTAKILNLNWTSAARFPAIFLSLGDHPHHHTYTSSLVITPRPSSNPIVAWNG